MKNAFGGLVCVYYRTQITQIKQMTADFYFFLMITPRSPIKNPRKSAPVCVHLRAIIHTNQSPRRHLCAITCYTPTQLITPNAVPIDVKIVINVWITIFQISFLFAMLFN